MSERMFSVAILKWILVTVPLSLLCDVAGIAMLLLGDRSFAVLSFALAGSCTFQTASDGLAVKTGKLHVIEGMCTDITAPFRKFRGITLMNCKGREIKVQSPKNVRMIFGEGHRLYFRKKDTTQILVHNSLWVKQIQKSARRKLKAFALSSQ